MATTSKTSKSVPRLRYHANAYRFVFAALRCMQERLERSLPGDDDPEAEEEDAHITGQELLEGVRQLARDQFGLMAITVLRRWGVTSTEDIGRMVFELVERGEMRKTDRDSLDDFVGVYDFRDAFDRDYQVDTRAAFGRRKS
jgi:uncharacterized repeat protein (TIGR04138 family)